MTHPTRRRFLTITAALATFGLPARAEPLRLRGAAMGSAASLIIDHPQADRIAARVWAEVSRLEDIFSLYRPQSSLSRLNADGRLEAPPFELLECLSLAGAVHAATGGVFDPTIQPLWAETASALSAGRTPDLVPLLPLVGWGGVSLDSDQITLARPGMALTLNGIAQGYVADRIASLLRAEGLTDIVIDMGEVSALGGDPRGGDWSARVAGGPLVPLRNLALATSAPMGTVLDASGLVGHILDPQSGLPTALGWRQISVTAPQAALADALSTAFCLMDRPAISATLARLPDTSLVHAV